MIRFFQTDDSFHGLVLRLVVGAVMLPHGLQKLVGWFGGYGFEGTMGFFTGTLGIPTVVALTVILAESIGAVVLLTGALTRLWSALIAATMIGAVFTLHLPHGFFMNWNGNQAGEGFEYAILMVTMAGLLTVFGGGRYSVDAWIARRLDARAEQPAPVRLAA